VRRGAERQTLILTRGDVQDLLDLSDCIDAVEAAFADPAAKTGVLGMHLDGGGFHIKAAAAGGMFVTKINGNFAGSSPRIQGVVVLCPTTRGAPLAIMDSGELTAIRTAAATGVAARHLARTDASTVTIVGCGEQAPWQLRAVTAVRTITRVFAYDLDRERAARVGTPVDSLEDAVAQSDIVITCTPSTTPILFDVPPGTFVAAVGADAEHKQEIDPQLMARAAVVPDLLEQAATIGDLHHAIAAGVMTRDAIRAGLGDVVAGRKPGRLDDDEIVIFDSTGTALQDVAAASIVYQRAVRMGRGVRLDLAEGGRDSM
jgi:alanine dehydrogenase